MSLRLAHDLKDGGFSGWPTLFLKSAVVAAISAFAAFLLLAAGADQWDLPPNTLWEVVHNICVPGQIQDHNPKPCLQVNLGRGIETGFAILKDPRGGTQFLLVPTVRISGIESPLVRGPQATNYFADAWELRALVDEGTRLKLSRDQIGMAINSAVGRSQDQLHIHFSCIRSDVWKSLHDNQKRIGNHWAPLDVELSGHDYLAMWLAGENIASNNPFELLAQLPDSARGLADRTLVVVGFTRTDQSKGFVLLTDRANKENNDLANETVGPFLSGWERDPLKRK